MRTVIDLNADLGEGIGDDIALLDVVTSANIACGFHAGNAATMRRTVIAAAARGIAIGAHVAYADREEFGRRAMDLAPDELTAIVLDQIAALDGLSRAAGARVRYVKPHGALYHRIAHDEVQAGAVVDALVSYRTDGYGEPLALLCLPGSVALDLAGARGVPVVTEAFADRAYRADGSLVPRGEPGAVLSDPSMVAARAAQMVRDGSVRAATTEDVTIDARSLCVHGDSPRAVDMARAVRARLEELGVRIQSFVGLL